IQAASIFFPAFDAPPWVMKIFIIVVILGFPVALIFSWAFEITPEGIKLESEIEPSKSIKRRTGRKIVAVTIALAVVAAGLFVYQMVGRDRWARRSNVETAEEGRPGGASLHAPNKSIAVLPFVNMSADKNDEYLSDGYHLWSKDYDGDVKDILNFQSNVAEQVVQALQVKLGGDEKRILTKRPTENPEAHRLYLLGRYEFGKYTQAGWNNAIRYYE